MPNGAHKFWQKKRKEGRKAMLFNCSKIYLSLAVPLRLLCVSSLTPNNSNVERAVDPDLRTIFALAKKINK
jgi:hypothetical protein